ncbi:DUF1580 domain-containing protein [Lacipirellula sp.]|uniref:DUF1580 domain-containing protein n=1 Tax=Lacipirellula sp. TaxID=2691419 RepID=UPI003D144124
MQSPIDIRRETPLPLSDVPHHVPHRSGRKIHYSTVYRWATKGARGRVLESQLLGGIRFTSHEALERFFSLDPPVAQIGSSGIDAINRALDRVGI